MISNWPINWLHLKNVETMNYHFTWDNLLIFWGHLIFLFSYMLFFFFFKLLGFVLFSAAAAACTEKRAEQQKFILLFTFQKFTTSKPRCTNVLPTVFSQQTNFDSGETSWCHLLYDSMDQAKKFEPKLRWDTFFHVSVVVSVVTVVTSL